MNLPVVELPAHLYEIREREIAQGQKVQLVLVEGELRIECEPGYRIVATRKRDGSKAVLVPHWPYDAASGVSQSMNSVMVMTAMRWHTDIRAESKLP